MYSKIRYDGHCRNFFWELNGPWLLGVVNLQMLGKWALSSSKLTYHPSLITWSLVSISSFVVQLEVPGMHIQWTCLSWLANSSPQCPNMPCYDPDRTYPTFPCLLQYFRPCLVGGWCKRKFFSTEFYQFEVLNEVYLQIFLHRWVVNREMNLIMLINPWLINN